jgi:hypothetical protein
MSSQRALVLCSLSLLAGCSTGPADSRGLSVSNPNLPVTVASLSDVGQSHPTLVSFVWLSDGGDTSSSVGDTPLRDKLPTSMGLAIGVPTKFWMDFEKIAAQPSCPTGTAGPNCWDERKGQKPMGKGRVALGTAVAFEDADDDNRYGGSPADPLLGQSPFFLIYTEGLDAPAIAALGKYLILNPQALKAGFNVAQVRCKQTVDWMGNRDPFEIVDPGVPVIVESKEAFDARVMAQEICENWS